MTMTKSWKHCVKRRNCMFCAISSFVTMFSKSRQKASKWGKGLITSHLSNNLFIIKTYRNSFKVYFKSSVLNFLKLCAAIAPPHVYTTSLWRRILTLFHIPQICSRRLWKHSDIRGNCLFLAISPFITLFSKVVCCRGVRKHLYVGKG